MTAVWETTIGPATKRLVLLALADSANDEGVCWPKVDTLARKAGCSRTAAEDALRTLAADGIISKSRAGRGRYQSTVFTIDSHRLQAPEFRAPAPQTPEIQHSDPRDSGTQTPEIRVQEPLVEPEEETKEEISLVSLAGISLASLADADPPQQLFDLPASLKPPKATPDDQGFAQWYDAYPRRVGRGQAEKAYRRALKLQGVTRELLLEAATQYAAERQGKEKEFTPYPATWLNGQRWADEKAGRDARRAQTAATQPEASPFGPASVPMSEEEAQRMLERSRAQAPSAARVLGKKVYEPPRFGG